MKFTVRIRRRAEEDIREARDWYDRIRPDLGRDFGDKLDAVIDSLATHPLIYARIYNDIRCAMTRRFRTSSISLLRNIESRSCACSITRATLASGSANADA